MTVSKNAAAVALGKRRMEKLTPEERKAMSRKGGKRRLKTLTPARRKAIAKAAVAARWAKKAK
jgi:hypothetical protein